MQGRSLDRLLMSLAISHKHLVVSHDFFIKRCKEGKNSQLERKMLTPLIGKQEHPNVQRGLVQRGFT
jgi:hypothetical protein